MGCDGGTIPTRDELVKTKKRPEQKDKDSERLFQWQHCHLTQQPLDRPVVACHKGRLYNKEAIIRMLLDRKTNKDDGNNQSAVADHIKSLRDVRELDLTPNPSFRRKNPSVGDGGYVDRLVSPWICPITGLEMNGRFKFVADWSDGRVLSDRGHSMLDRGEEDRIRDEDLVVLNPAEKGDEESNERRGAARRARAREEKKNRKAGDKRKAAEDTKPEVGTSKQAKSATNGTADKGKAGGSNKAKNGNASSSSTSSSVQNDPSKSEVYKSLFSSHKSAQNRPKGNWVTFDPRYN